MVLPIRNCATFKYFFPKRQILDASKLKEFADDNFELDENGRKFSKRVEITVGKGEIAFYKQFLLFSHSVFKRLSLQTRKNQDLFGVGLKQKNGEKDKNDLENDKCIPIPMLFSNAFF